MTTEATPTRTSTFDDDRSRIAAAHSAAAAI
jgi:hypothetical protein